MGVVAPASYKGATTPTAVKPRRSCCRPRSIACHVDAMGEAAVVLRVESTGLTPPTCPMAVALAAMQCRLPLRPTTGEVAAEAARRPFAKADGGWEIRMIFAKVPAGSCTTSLTVAHRTPPTAADVANAGIA